MFRLWAPVLIGSTLWETCSLCLRLVSTCKSAMILLGLGSSSGSSSCRRLFFSHWKWQRRVCAPRAGPSPDHQPSRRQCHFQFVDRCATSRIICHDGPVLQQPTRLFQLGSRSGSRRKPPDSVVSAAEFAGLHATGAARRDTQPTA